MNTLKKQIKRYLNFCFSFEGRLNRKAFLFSWLKLTGLSLVYFLIIMGPAASLFEDSISLKISRLLPSFLGIVIFTLCILGLIANFSGFIAIQIKRLHDLSFSGWWFLAVTIINLPVGLAASPDVNLSLPEALRSIAIVVNGIVSIGWFIITFFIKGSQGENKYGKDPLWLSEA